MYLKKIICFFSVLIFSVSLFNNLICAGTPEVDNAVKKEGNLLPQQVHSLPIPEKMSFAGKNVALERYDLRERLDREILAFTYMHSTTFLLIKRANLYFPIIEPILKENNIPDDFKYLALIESYLNPRSVSPAKAAGVWQFLTETGKEYGLEVNSQVDERFHLEKATTAACKYLQDSYDLYSDWALAAAAYNAGKNRITTELEKQRVDNYFDLYLNEETSRYVFRILAAKEILSNPQKFGFNLSKEDFYHTVRIKEVEVSGVIENWGDWAKNYGITYAQLKYFNHWIRDIKLDNKSGKTYKVKIPYIEDLDFDVKKVKIHNKNWMD